MRTRATRCYIDEYTNEAGTLSARLREKITGRKVDLGIADAEARTHLLQFLSAAKQNQADFPDYFDKDADESIVVTGEVDFDAPDEIRYLYNGELSYLFG
jgi:hypothetical protein